MAWVDVSNNVRPFADDEGQVVLNNWNFATENYELANQPGAVNDNISFNTLQQAASSFSLLSTHINDPVLAGFFGDTYDSFSDALATQNPNIINQYMIDAYPNFKQQICNP